MKDQKLAITQTLMNPHNTKPFREMVKAEYKITIISRDKMDVVAIRTALLNPVRIITELVNHLKQKMDPDISICFTRRSTNKYLFK